VTRHPVLRLSKRKSCSSCTETIGWINFVITSVTAVCYLSGENAGFWCKKMSGVVFVGKCSGNGKYTELPSRRGMKASLSVKFPANELEGENRRGEISRVFPTFKYHPGRQNPELEYRGASKYPFYCATADFILCKIIVHYYLQYCAFTIFRLWFLFCEIYVHGSMDRVTFILPLQLGFQWLCLSDQWRTYTRRCGAVCRDWC